MFVKQRSQACTSGAIAILALLICAEQQSRKIYALLIG